ncbi:MAG: phosphate/phosphite/phosphonate ABC transporter substrate-binding protein [Reinekea sp.]
MRAKNIVRTTTILLFGFISSVVMAADYKIGVLAKNGATKAVKEWGDTANYLNSALPEDTFTIAPLSFEEVFPAIENQSVDFFLVNSSMFITAKVKYDASAIATMINSRQGQALNSFGGVILTYIDRDDINKLEDLKGKTFMAVEASSFGGWQMAYKEFLDHGIDPISDLGSLQFGNKHDNVVLAIQNGEVDAGTVRTDTLERMEATGDISLSEFKILSKKKFSNFPFVVSTALYPEWPFAKIHSIPDAVAQKVADALIKMPSDHVAAKHANIVGWSEPLDYSEVDVLQKLLKVGAYNE